MVGKATSLSTLTFPQESAWPLSPGVALGRKAAGRAAGLARRPHPGLPRQGGAQQFSLWDPPACRPCRWCSHCSDSEIASLWFADFAK